MFGKKQEYTKELEERLNTAQYQLEDLQNQIKQAASSSQQIPHCFEAQIIAQSDMDKNLAQVLECVQESLETSTGCGQAYEQFAIEFTGMRQQLEEEEQKKKELQEAVRRQREQMEAAEGESRQLTVPAALLQEIRNDLSSGVQEAYGQLKEMQELSKQMSVLSLNCAIEAGRMGEDGRQFVGAAEDVRQMSNAYEQGAKALRQQLEAVEKHLGRLEEQSDELARTLKSSEEARSQLSKSMTETEDICEKASERIFSEKALALAGIIKKVSQNHDRITSLQSRAAKQMERIGESLKEEQEARKEMEDIMDKVMDILHN